MSILWEPTAVQLRVVKAWGLGALGSDGEEGHLKKPKARGPAPTASIETLQARASEALRQQRFKKAADLFKLLVRQDPRPEWKQGLAEAYEGRAHVLAAKGMLKEAAMVLENTLAADGTLLDPLFYLNCLIRDGQQQKAATHALLYVGHENTLPAEARSFLEDLTAALLMVVPVRPAPAQPGASAPAGPAAERNRWLEAAAAACAALETWVGSRPVAEVESLLGRISLRSRFRPVRLLLKALLDGPQEAERSRRLLEAIPPGSAFFSLREAAETVLSGERGVDADLWLRLTPVQRRFVAETRGLPAAATEFLARSDEAARGGPGTLFNFLIRQNDLPQAEIRSACLNLLPQAPDRIQQFEKAFGPLSPPERERIQALAAEAGGDWARAERFWRNAASSVQATDPQAGLIRGLIYRHLAWLAERHREIRGDPEARDSSPVADYLAASCEADPDYVPGVLQLIGRYRSDNRPKDWHRLAEEAAQRFADNSAVLQAATESAVARSAFKKAAGFARRLLRIDPINVGVRQQMIELAIAHARKQVRSKRPDLAVKDLAAAAAEWERADTPSAALRIARGLAGLQAGEGAAAEALVQEGVRLAGGGCAGWFRTMVEVLLMHLDTPHAERVRKELGRARQAESPTRDAVLAVIATFGQAEEGEGVKRALRDLLVSMTPWLEKAAGLDWPTAEFQTVADALTRFEAFGLLRDYTHAARRRDPTNRDWQFYDIVARTQGHPERMSVLDVNVLDQLGRAATDRNDLRTAMRIRRFLEGNVGSPYGRRRAPPSGLDDEFGADAIDELIEMLTRTMPRDLTRDLRGMTRELGREAAIATLSAMLHHAPMMPDLPEEMMREVCAAMIDNALTVPGRSQPARRGRG